MELFRLQTIDPALLDAERARIRAELAAILPLEPVHEVGSTAIAGVVGKQDLDFLVRVPPNAFETTRLVLDAHFARNPGQLSNEAFQGYRVASPLDAALQLTVIGSEHDRFLEFLTRLENSAALRAEYNALKRSFDGDSMEAYRDAKGRFIEAVLGSATGVRGS
jgi:GrpB-like predicted nucleotidyltransferase (UPF0157 family)